VRRLRGLASNLLAVSRRGFLRLCSRFDSFRFCVESWGFIDGSKAGRVCKLVEVKLKGNNIGPSAPSQTRIKQQCKIDTGSCASNKN
jgi:hypothetical protein